METTRQEPATLGLFVRLEANPGREDDVAAFLLGALALVREEPATTTWFAVRMEPATFGIFDTFPDEAGRQAHLEGRVAAGLKARAPELFAEEPVIERTEVLAAKLRQAPAAGRRSRAPPGGPRP